MASQEEKQAFRDELINRFDELVRWATDAWPDKNRPLTAVDLVPLREQLANIVSQAEQHQAATSSALDPEDGGGQFRQVTPAPWP